MDKPIKISENMAKTTIDYLRLEPASNGFIISYTEKVKASGKGTYDNTTYNDKKEVFDVDSEVGEDSKEDIDKAFSRFRELAMKQYNELNAKG